MQCVGIRNITLENEPGYECSSCTEKKKAKQEKKKLKLKFKLSKVPSVEVGRYQTS